MIRAVEPHDLAYCAVEAKDVDQPLAFKTARSTVPLDWVTFSVERDGDVGRVLWKPEVLALLRADRQLA